MAKIKPARGTPIAEAFDRITASKMIDAANQRDEGAQQTVNPIQAADHVWTSKILILNDGTVEFARNQPVVLSTPAILPAANAFAADLSNTPINASEASSGGASSEWHNFALCDAPLQVGFVGWASFRGLLLCQIEVPTGLDWCNRADVFATATNKQLKVAPQGSARIHWKETGTGTGKWALVELAAGGNVRYVGKTSAAIADNATTGTVTLWKNGSTTSHTISGVHLNWATGSEGISSGIEVLVEWYEYERIWRITGADCEA